MAGKVRKAMLSEIARRRVREMYPAGFTVQDIAGVTRKTEKYIRSLVLQEFPHGKPITEQRYTPDEDETP